jgi:hypothetical protein
MADDETKYLLEAALAMDLPTLADLLAGRKVKAETPAKRDGVSPAPHRRKRRPTLVNLAKQASKAGIDVARYEIDVDGKISIVTGKPAADQTNDLDKWMAKHSH